MTDPQALIDENTRLKRQLADYRYLFDTSELAMLIIDTGGTYLDYNQAYYKLIGYTKKSQLENFHPAKISPAFQPDGQNSFDKANRMIDITLQDGQHSFEWMHQKANGDPFLSTVTLKRIQFDGKTALRAIIEDVTETRKLERLVEEKTQELTDKNEKLEKLSHTDALTGLYNRRKLDEILTDVWDFSSRAYTPIGLLFLDIDNFKAFNDNYGHSEGDTVLEKLAQLIQDTVKRKTDYVARYGGEEFVIVLAPTEYEYVQKMAEEILQAVNELNIPHEHSSIADHVTLSIGCAITHPGKPNRSAEEWIERADEMLYKAKKSGKNRFEITEID
ncbi:sensor domain-containing diguanylate cyclase [Thiomicrorhabdus chilensis]|uniref:sensor domain-containing diguanylate cyclase n=1 Tax=Thiomicrorhabdus chilensis TaxID=63656 RepID=UPI0003FC6CFC|nr:diguanylate cyclase [Thiomicrorhabdus chilensis]